VDGHPAKNLVLPFQHHEALPLEHAPGQLACLGEQAADSLLARRLLDGFVQPGRNAVACCLGRAE